MSVVWQDHPKIHMEEQRPKNTEDSFEEHDRGKEAHGSKLHNHL